MGKNKKYDGYKPFEYLEEGVDYKEFELPCKNDMFWADPYDVPLSKAERERVNKLAENSIFISLHDHPVLWPKPEEIYEYHAENRLYTAYEWLSKSTWDAVFDNLQSSTRRISSENPWKFQDVVYDIGMRLSDIAHQDFLIHGKSIKDIQQAKDEGKLALILAHESSSMIEKEVDRIDILYGLGIRMMGIVYNDTNYLGTGLGEKQDGGLSEFGRKAVQRMNKIGMAIDVSHAGINTSLDTFEVSDKPIFITHAGSKNVWNIERLKEDEVLKACAETGGIIGIEAAPHSTVSETHPRHSIDSFMDHFEYIVDLVGLDHVSFGPDTLYGDHVGLHRALAGDVGLQNFTREGYDVMKTFTEEGEETPEREGVKGLENPTECSNNIVRWLVKHGYSDKEIKKVMGGNTLRVLEEVW